MASSGPEALKAIQNLTTPVDLLVTDYAMPGMQGRELADRVRERFPLVRVLLPDHRGSATCCSRIASSSKKVRPSSTVPPPAGSAKPPAWCCSAPSTLLIAPLFPSSTRGAERATVRPAQAYTAVVSVSRPVRLVLGLLLSPSLLDGRHGRDLRDGRTQPQPAAAGDADAASVGDLPETAPDVVLPVRRSHSLTVRGYVEVIRKAKHDRRVARLLIRPGGLDSPFWAKVQEIREAIVDFRQSGKPVYAFLEYGRRPGVLPGLGGRQGLPAPDLHARSDRAGELRGLPRAARSTGSAPIRTSCTSATTRRRSTRSPRRRFTPAHREMSESLNQRSVRSAGARDRRRPPQVRGRGARADRSRAVPARGGASRRAGRRARLRGRARRCRRRVGSSAQIEVDRLRARHLGVARRVAARARRRGQRRRHDRQRPRAASIRSTAPCSDPIRSSRTSARPAAAAPRRIVLRIDSPGGSSVASDVIWRELMITKDQGLPVWSRCRTWPRQAATTSRRPATSSSRSRAR